MFQFDFWGCESTVDSGSMNNIENFRMISINQIESVTISTPNTMGN